MIVKVEIENFKSIKYLDYSATKLNLLTGLNGSGKSSFIQTLRALQQLSHTVHSLEGKKAAEYMSPNFLSLPDLGMCDQSDLFYAYDKGNAHLTFELDQEKFGVYILRGDLNSDLVNLELDGNCPDVELRYLTSDRTALHAEYARKPKRRFDLDGSGAISFMADELWKSDFCVPGVLCREGYDSDDLQGQINAWMDLISPGVCLECSQNDDAVEATTEIWVGYAEDEGDPHAPVFRSSNVGYGVSYSFPLIASLLTVRPNDVIVLENPELHLHPRGQAMMGDLIARAVAAGAQVFIETHSDHVINGIRVAVKKGIVQPRDVNIAFFDRGEHLVCDDVHNGAHREVFTQVSNVKVDRNGALSDYPKGFMEEWCSQLLELLK